MRGFLCDMPACGTFVPTLPPGTLRYLTNDDDGKPIEQTADLCRTCSDAMAETLGLDVPVSDDTELIEFQGANDAKA